MLRPVAKSGKDQGSIEVGLHSISMCYEKCEKPLLPPLCDRDGSRRKGRSGSWKEGSASWKKKRGSRKLITQLSPNQRRNTPEFIALLLSDPVRNPRRKQKIGMRSVQSSHDNQAIRLLFEKKDSLPPSILQNGGIGLHTRKRSQRPEKKSPP